MQAETLKQIARLRSLIGAQRLQLCEMRHEAVSPVDASRGVVCPRRIRAANVACSHTSARLAQREAWLLLETLGAARARERREALSRLDGEISVLDHRRYDAEAARCAPTIAACVEEHRRLGEEAEAMRREVLEALDAASRSASGGRLS